VTYSGKPLFLDDLKKALQQRYDFSKQLVKDVGIQQMPPAK